MLTQKIEMPSTLTIKQQNITLQGTDYLKRFTVPNVYSTDKGNAKLLFEIGRDIIPNKYSLTVRLSDPIINDTIIVTRNRTTYGTIRQKNVKNINSVDILEKVIEETIDSFSNIKKYKDLPCGVSIEYSKHIPFLMRKQLIDEGMIIIEHSFRHGNGMLLANFNEDVHFTCQDDGNQYCHLMMRVNKEDNIGTIRTYEK
jgi:hypothetical protein